MNLGGQLEDVREEVLDFLGADREEEEEEEGTPSSEPAQQQSNSKSKTPALDSFGRDLTELAREGKLDAVIGRANEIERVIQILSRRTKNNPVLLGEPGVGKTASSRAWPSRSSRTACPTSCATSASSCSTWR